MRIGYQDTQQAQRGSVMISYFIVMVIVVSAIAWSGAYVVQSASLAHRRSDMIAAMQFAQGGAVIGCNDVNSIVTNKTTNSTMTAKLATLGYSLNSSLSTSSETVYQRTISSPFTNQTVTAQIRVPSGSSPGSAKVVALATFGKVTQTATVNVKMTWAYPGAIISTNPGTKSTSISKDVDSGNVVVNGDKTGPIVVDGGTGLAILANGYVNIDTAYAKIPTGSISSTNFNSANEVPDYTAQGTGNTLFDFARYVALADRTTNQFNPTKNNHFTNLLTFFNANKSAYSNAVPAARFLEGVIVVDIAGKDSNLSNFDPSHVPNGINVKGSLFFKFDSSFGPSDKVVNTATMNINPANLTNFVATNSATYTSGYPPVYYDNSRNPTNISLAGTGFANVTPEEDLPALMYSIGILDIHGNANVCGVMYTPSFVEIENKADNQIQYFKGSIICGLGMYFENNSKSSSVISFDNKALDSLGTMGMAGKQVKVAYWE